MLDVALTAIALAAGSHGPALRPQPLSMADAKTAAWITADDLAVPFTEHKPQISMACDRLAPKRVLCHVRVLGDRISVRFDAKARPAGGGGVWVFASHLERVW